MITGQGSLPRAWLRTIHVSVISQKQMSTVFVDEGGLTPLFRAKRVKRTIFGNAKLKAGFGPAEVSSILDLDDDALEQALFDEVDMVDKVVLGDA
jgi:hypothetical protein